MVSRGRLAVRAPTTSATKTATGRISTAISAAPIFSGQETVWHKGVPVWAMNYYGRILQPDRIDAAMAGRVIKQALSALYSEGRFLGGFTFMAGPRVYIDRSDGNVGSFSGHEVIEMDRAAVYRLDYHGGLIKP